MNISNFDLALICFLLPLIPVLGIVAGQYIHRMFGSTQDATGNKPPSWQEEELVPIPVDSSSCRACHRKNPDMYN